MILVKRYYSAETADLYRNLFCVNIDELFRSNQLPRYLDYSLDSTTYARGAFVYLNLKTHTKGASKLAEKVRGLNIRLDQASIGVGIATINAETGRKLANPNGIEDIQKELKELHATPWQDIDDIGLINAAGINTNIGALALTNERLSLKNLTISTLLDPKFAKAHPHLLPLAHQITYLIMENAEMILLYRYGLYRSNIHFANRPTQKALVSSTLSTAHPEAIDNRISDCLNAYIEEARRFRENETFERFMRQLRNASHAATPSVLPSLGRLLKSTHIFIGPKGWRDIATVKNCNLVLENMSIEVKYNRRRLNQPIIEKEGPAHSRTK